MVPLASSGAPAALPPVSAAHCAALLRSPAGVKNQRKDRINIELLAFPQSFVVA